MQTLEQQPFLITEEQIIAPLVEVLDKVTPSLSPPQSLSPSLKESLDQLFPEQQHEDKNIQKAKQILGEKAAEFTTEQFRDLITEVQYLVNTWLDDFERETFNGQTLKELLHEKGKV